MFFGELPQNEVAGVPQAEIARAVQALANVAALANLATRPVFLLLCCTDLAEVDLDIRREL